MTEWSDRFNLGGQGKVPASRLAQSSSGKMMVITGSPSSPGPTINFGVMSVAPVAPRLDGT